MKNENAFRNQLMFGICDGLSTMIAGATFGYTSTSLVSMYKDRDFDVTEEQGNWIGSIVPGMALIGSLMSNKILESIGRKSSMLLATFVSILSWLMIGYSHNIYQVLTARLFCGLAMGLQQVAVSVYMSETVHPKLRSIFAIIPSITGAIGFSIISIVPDNVAGWRGVSILGALLSCPLVV